MSLKMCALVALFVVGMSSCLKPDDSLNVGVYAYVLQNSDGTFTPQVRLSGNNLASASVNVAGMNFAFTKVDDWTWELSNGSYFPLGRLDTIPANIYMLTVSGLNGKTETFGLGFQTTKRMSSVELTTLEYVPSEKKINVELADSVQNATAYFLMITAPTGKDFPKFLMWTPYGDGYKLELTGDKKLSATVSVPYLGTGTYRFAVGASYNSNYAPVFRISEKTITVTNEKQVE